MKNNYKNKYIQHKYINTTQLKEKHILLQINNNNEIKRDYLLKYIKDLRFV